MIVSILSAISTVITTTYSCHYLSTDYIFVIIHSSLRFHLLGDPLYWISLLSLSLNWIRVYFNFAPYVAYYFLLLHDIYLNSRFLECVVLYWILPFSEWYELLQLQCLRFPRFIIVLLLLMVSTRIDGSHIVLYRRSPLCTFISLFPISFQHDVVVYVCTKTPRLHDISKRQSK